MLPVARPVAAQHTETDVPQACARSEGVSGAERRNKAKEALVMMRRHIAAHECVQPADRYQLWLERSIEGGCRFDHNHARV